MNVTAQLHRSAISETVKVFGGFDGFINAGVVKAEMLKPSR